MWSVSESVRPQVETKLVKIKGSTGVDRSHNILYTVYIKLRRLQHMTPPDDNTEYRDFMRYLKRDMPRAEWESYQEIIRTHPESVKAVEQLESITKLVQQWTEGLLLATEATSEMKRILNGEGN